MTKPEPAPRSTYRDWRSIRKEDYANREDEGVMLVPKAGEMLYHLKQRPLWAREM